MQNVAKLVHDRISPESMSKTMYCRMEEGPLNCLSLNRDNSQVVVAGRNVFKVLQIEDHRFVQKHNLRVGRNINLNYSTTDVTWNPVEDHIIASAATNGAVCTWNLNMSSRSKQECVFNDHKRMTNRVVFNPNDHLLLLSGSQDKTMKMFDLRQKAMCVEFSWQSDSIRDVQFDPRGNNFAAALENGNIQIWDYRMNRRPEKTFTAHNGPVFTIDYHPEDKSWLASGGRDRTIKVWDMSNPVRLTNTHTVQTIYSVPRIKWRPQRKYHIASCALQLDCTINVWDIRRPYIPFATFTEHKDVVTGIQWKFNDAHNIFACSKEGVLYQHLFKDAIRPADKANPVGVGISVFGEVTFAKSDKLDTQQDKTKDYPITRLPFFKKQTDKSEQFTKASSHLLAYELLQPADLSMAWFTYSAKKYQLTGKPLDQLCDINAQVAEDLGRYQVSQTWRMLKVLYCTCLPTTPTQTTAKVSLNTKDTGDNRSNVAFQESSDVNEVDETTSGVSDDDSDEKDQDLDAPNNTITHIASEMNAIGNHSDFFFGDGDIDQTTFDFDNINNIQNGPDWSLPSEAFQLRQDIDEQNNGDPLTQANAQETSLSSSVDNDVKRSTFHHHSVESQIKQGILNAAHFLSQAASWSFTHSVTDMLKFYAEMGDVQTCVSMIIVLGDKIRKHVDLLTQEQWFTSYIDLLARFKLWSIMTEVISLSRHPVISSFNQQSTTININCGRQGPTAPCNRILKNGWMCDHCRVIHNCVICHHPVKGLYVWCQGCAHGGHLEHLQQWFKKDKRCPSGCGHYCEYT